jgi:hypothetical protein
VLTKDLWPTHYQPVIQDTDGNSIQHTKHDLFLIHHFTQFAGRVFADKWVAELYTGPILELAKEYPYLMHAMLAMSGCHLQHLGVDASRYRSAEAFHSHFASKGLREALVSMNTARDGDGVLTTAMLLGTVAFCAADYRDNVRPPLEERRKSGQEWNWLRTQSGLSCLLTRTTPYRKDSIWDIMFSAIDEMKVDEEEEFTDLGQRLKNFCGFDENSSEATSPCFELADWLDPLVSRGPDLKYLGMYLRSIGAMSLEFIDLLEKGNTHALLLFAHWLALMSSIDQWWCTRRIITECQSICEVLAKRLEGESIKLLEAPAKACGYQISTNSSYIEEIDCPA